ncbi:uncharacterized protein A4U43_C01F7810 [Asparagus officinalis]|uniref:Uncharacterized protein n=1 Tax=Asparagus officinalis TaxID=4686 RepID=A0A5P1FRH7_ASPOF|nr:uncharacterized protein A4U43_C01F7810 [Asparagus officinalis]
MATRLLARSKTLALNRTFINRPSQSLRPLHSLTAPLDLGSYQPSPSSRSLLRPDLAAASESPAIPSILGSKMILGYEKTLPRWFSVNPQGESTSQKSLAEKMNRRLSEMERSRRRRLGGHFGEHPPVHPEDKQWLLASAKPNQITSTQAHFLHSKHHLYSARFQACAAG